MRAILTFHSVDDSGSVISFSPSTFAALIEAVGRRHAIVDLDALLDGGDGVAITFDDGMRSVFQHALPVLETHGVPAHLFLTTNTVGRPTPWPDPPADIPAFPMLGWHEVEALARGGIRIENHTTSHPDLRATSDADITTELDHADAIIEERLGRRPKYFAYPFGYYDDRTRDLVRHRYRASVTTELRTLATDEDPTALPRLDAYYLQDPRWFETLGDPATRAYLSARSLLRTIRGSHVVPQAGYAAAVRRAILPS